jgi:desulfoferrodoxin-like iron-binding protein
MNTGAGSGTGIITRECAPGPSQEISETKDMVNVSKEGQVFKCEICGNVVVVKEAGGGELICCGEPMVLEE